MSERPDEPRIFERDLDARDMPRSRAEQKDNMLRVFIRNVTALERARERGSLHEAEMAMMALSGAKTAAELLLKAPDWEA